MPGSAHNLVGQGVLSHELIYPSLQKNIFRMEGGYQTQKRRGRQTRRAIAGGFFGRTEIANLRQCAIPKIAKGIRFAVRTAPLLANLFPSAALQKFMDQPTNLTQFSVLDVVPLGQETDRHLAQGIVQKATAGRKSLGDPPFKLFLLEAVGGALIQDNF
jgi:hypothetical protein